MGFIAEKTINIYLNPNNGITFSDLKEYFTKHDVTALSVCLYSNKAYRFLQPYHEDIIGRVKKHSDIILSENKGSVSTKLYNTHTGRLLSNILDNDERSVYVAPRMICSEESGKRNIIKIISFDLLIGKKGNE